MLTDKPIPKLDIKYEGLKEVATAEEALATLEDLKKKYDRSSVPGVMTYPFRREAAFEYAKGMKLLMVSKPKDIAWLKKLDGAQLKGTDSVKTQMVNNTRDSVLSRLEKYLPKDMDYSLTNTRKSLSDGLPLKMDFIQKGAEADPTDPNQARNIFLRPEIVALRKQAISEVINAIDVLTILNSQLELKNDLSDLTAKKKQVKEWANTYAQKLTQAAGSLKPPTDVGDAELTKIAEDVLSDKKYKLPQWGRLIINTKKKSQRRTEYWLDRDVDYYSIERVPLNWEEFQATTIEKGDDGKFYMWANTIMFYKEGPHTVPVGKWSLGERFRTAPIAKENIEN